MSQQSEYALEVLKLSRSNVGAGERMKAAHEDAAYNKWFRAQVQASLDDPRPSIPDATVKKHFAAKRKAVEKQLKTAA